MRCRREQLDTGFRRVRAYTAGIGQFPIGIIQPELLKIQVKYPGRPQFDFVKLAIGRYPYADLVSFVSDKPHIHRIVAVSRIGSN